MTTKKSGSAVYSALRAAEMTSNLRQVYGLVSYHERLGSLIVGKNYLGILK